MYHALLPLILMLAAPPAQEAGTGPEPSARPIAWEFEFKFLEPRRLEIQLPGSAAPEVYWYMLYTVINPGPRSQRFFPLIQLVTDDLVVHDTDNGISALVFDEIRARHQITHKYLVHPTQAIGALLTGDDNARESAAIWRDVDLTNNSFTIYVGGLSGETRLVPNPAFDSQKPDTPTTTASAGNMPTAGGNPKYFTLRKTLEIQYNLPGSPQARARTVPERGATRWIMR